MLACVAAVGDAEAEVEIEVLQQPILKVMTLDHPEITHGTIADGKLHPSQDDKDERKKNNQSLFNKNNISAAEL